MEPGVITSPNSGIGKDYQSGAGALHSKRSANLSDFGKIFPLFLFCFTMFQPSLVKMMQNEA